MEHNDKHSFLLRYVIIYDSKKIILKAQMLLISLRP